MLVDDSTLAFPMSAEAYFLFGLKNFDNSDSITERFKDLGQQFASMRQRYPRATKLVLDMSFGKMGCEWVLFWKYLFGTQPLQHLTQSLRLTPLVQNLLKNFTSIDKPSGIFSTIYNQYIMNPLSTPLLSENSEYSNKFTRTICDSSTIASIVEKMIVFKEK
ncbi:hypothetical protein HDU97_002988 [Phlyctochytrium planicorne]|nr:hypothetical protein HDU97_002988 [Phlyctochytrium planicorne]